MDILIDTQILIWLGLLHPSLTKKTQELLTDTNNRVFVPELALLEISIKQKVGKLPQLTWDTNTIERQIIKDGFETMPVKILHISYYNSIPLFADHKDPFDRLLVATAISENMHFISSDPKFKQYQPLLLLIENQVR